VLESFGLSEAASKCYCQARKWPGQPLISIGNVLGLSPTEARDGYQELVEIGLALPSPEAVAVVPLQESLKILRARQDVELIAKEALSQLEKSISQSPQPPKNGDFEVVTGESEIHRTLTSLGDATRCETATFAPGGAQRGAHLHASRQRDAEIFGRGVKSRTIYLTSARNDPETRRYVEWLNEQGAEARTTPTLPIRMIISDRKTAVLPVDPTPGNGMRGILVLHQPSVVAALQALFEIIWAAANPLGQPQSKTTDTHGLSADDWAVLEFLVLGRTTEELAKEMGISVRTARRMIESLMKRLNARSPFEGGYQAVKRGWV